MPSSILQTSPFACDKCGATTIHKQMIGVEWDRKINRSNIFYGNAFCSKCLEEIKDDVEEYRPSPGYSKPAAFIVARQKEHASVTGKEAITLAIAYGNWLKAAQIAKIALGKRKRFYPSELRCDNRYIYHRAAARSHPIAHEPIAQEPIAQLPIAQHPQLQPQIQPQLMAMLKSEKAMFKGDKTSCPVCGASCHVNKNGKLRAHRNDKDRTKLCTGY